MPHDAVAIEPLGGPFRAEVRVPGSKSMTNRALILAALADGETVVENALASDDTERMVAALRALGFAVESDEAAAIMSVAEATADGIRKVAEAIQQPGGYEAVQLRVAEQYIGEFGKLARTGTTMILPANLSDVGGMIATAMSVIKQTTPDGAANGRPRPAETR